MSEGNRSHAYDPQAADPADWPGSQKMSSLSDTNTAIQQWQHQQVKKLVPRRLTPERVPCSSLYFTGGN